MIRFFLRIYDTMNSHRWLPVTILLIVLSLCLVLTSRINYQEDISAFLPVDKETKEYTDVYSKLGGQDRIAVIFKGDSCQLIQAMDYFGDIVKQTDSLGLVNNLQVSIDEEYMLDVLNYVWRSYPLLLSDEYINELDTVLTLDYAKSQMEANRQMLILPFGNFMLQSLPSDPLHLSSNIISKLQNIGINSHYKIVDGHIFSKQENQGIVLLSSPFGISESKQNHQLVSYLNNVGNQVSSKFIGVKVSCIGAPVIAVTNASQIKEDSILAVSLSIILIFIVLYYSFRRLKDLGWIAVSIIFGWLVALGCISIFYDNISVIVLGIGSVIIGIAANYPLHFLDHLKHETDRRTALKEMITPLLIGNITTVSAFLCLIFINADAMRDLGIFASLMLVATIAFVLILLPSLVSQRNDSDKTYSILPDIKWKIRTPFNRFLFPFILFLTLFLGFLSRNTSFDSDIQNINYITEEQRDDLKQLYTSMQSNDTLATVFAVSKGNDLNSALISNEELMNLLHNDIRIHGIAGVNNILLSSDLISKRKANWEKLWKNHSDVMTYIKDETEKLGFSKGAFSQFLSLCNGDYTNLETVSNPLIETIGDNYILRDKDGSFRIVNILQVEKDSVLKLKDDLRSDINKNKIKAFVFDSTDVSGGLVTILSDSFNYIGFMCGFIVFAFLWISFGRLELSIISFLPLAVSWIWILGFMDLFSVQFNIVNIILATFIFGQGDDYSIFITEGMTYEYAYGRPRLKSYKNSVILSALLMFVGIGTLIIAKHPALRSLAEVTMIGMITVVLMTLYLPPLIFNWLIKYKGEFREIPITIKRLLYSIWSLLFFLFFSVLFFEPYALVQKFLLMRSRKCRKVFHKVLQATAKFVIYRVPGVRFQYLNPGCETFVNPAVIICNHQSHLDVMCLLMMSPKIVILTNDWVWHNPFYGAIIRAAEFYPISDGVDKNLLRLKDLVSRGYSVVIFPEGTRETGQNIMHFHKGAFYLAKLLNVDILPIMIHGLIDVLPKKDFMLREGTITVEVHQRMKANEVAKYEDNRLRSYWFKWYVEHYHRMRRELEDVEYFIPYVRYKYALKGADIERRCNKTLKSISKNSDCVKKYITLDKKIIIPNCGQGEIAWIAALTYPEYEIEAYEADFDLYSIAVNTTCKPSNLHFINQNYINK